MTWRNLSNAEKAAVVDAESAQLLMQAKTSVIKRPVLVQNNTVLCLGFDEAQYQVLLIDLCTKQKMRLFV